MAKICKILLVEDHREIQDLLRELFASEGYRFTIVEDGAAMRQAIAADAAIDVVVIDVLLPGGVDGLTLAAEACAHGLPVIIVTGDHTQIEGLKAAGHPYLLKPFVLADFVALIDQVLRASAAQCEREAPEVRGEKVVTLVAGASGAEVCGPDGAGRAADGNPRDGAFAIISLPRRRVAFLFGRLGRVLLRRGLSRRVSARPEL